MKSTIQYFSVVLLIFLFVFSCKKKDDEVIVSDAVCTVTETNSEGQKLNSYTFTNKRLSSTSFYRYGVLEHTRKFTYNSDLVIEQFYSAAGVASSATPNKYLLNQNGLAYIATKHYASDSERIDSIFYTYDGLGYLTKEVYNEYHDYSDPVKKTKTSITYNYTYTGGNLTSKTFNIPGDKHVQTFEYYSDLDDKYVEIEPSFLGKRSINLVKKDKENIYDATTNILRGEASSNDYSYDFDANNNVTKITSIDNQDVEHIVNLANECN
jgi:hypothetical protein